MEQRSNKKTPNEPNKQQPINIFNILIFCFIITSLLNMLSSYIQTNRKTLIDYTQFINLVENDCVERVVLKEDEILIHINKEPDIEKLKEIFPLNQNLSISDEDKEAYYKNLSKTVFYTGDIGDPEFVTRLVENNVRIVPQLENKNPIADFVMSWIFPVLFIYFIYSYMMKSVAKRFSGSEMGGGAFNVGKSKAKMYDIENATGITFNEVAGQEEAKESLKEIVDFLHNPAKYNKIGAKQPKGALLVGPPGTGKTLLAKAVAGEAKVPFFSLSGSDFVEMFVGVGASRVRDLFQQAIKKSPCIIFIDEIDAIGKSRDSKYGGGNDEREQTLNQLLSEMDGFDSSKGIVILAATNRPETLDKALLRPGRFDRRIIVEKPDLPGREEILKLHGNKIQKDDTIDFHQIALSTSGATGADLANIVNEAALRAVRLGKEKIDQSDLMESVEVIIAGKEKKDRILNPTERRIVAYHEVGHALASALQKNTMPVQKITIVPRTMGALGYTMNVPEEERYLMSKDEILAQIVSLLAGRAAEEVEFSMSTTGASNDIEKATRLARSFVTQYGMSERFDMVQLESSEGKYLDNRPIMNCSESTGAKIDEEVTKIIKECHNKAVELLKDSHEKLKEISEFLLEKETITGKEFMDILCR